MTLISNVFFWRFLTVMATRVAPTILSLIVKFFHKPKVMSMSYTKCTCVLRLVMGDLEAPNRLVVDTGIRIEAYVTLSLVDRLVRLKAFGLVSKARFIVTVTTPDERTVSLPLYTKVKNRWTLNPMLPRQTDWVEFEWEFNDINKYLDRNDRI